MMIYKNVPTMPVDEFQKKLKDYPHAIDGYKCPKCMKTGTFTTPVLTTEPFKNNESHEGFNWIELKRCEECNTEYINHNGV